MMTRQHRSKGPFPYKGGFISEDLFIAIARANGMSGREARSTWVDACEDVFLDRFTMSSAGEYLGSMLETLSNQTFDVLWARALKENNHG